MPMLCDLQELKTPPRDENAPDIVKEFRRWEAYCDCGKTIRVRSDKLDDGHSVTCPDCSNHVQAEKVYDYYKKRYYRATNCFLCSSEIGNVNLNAKIPDDKAYQIACFVTHYRHAHTQYDRSVKYVAKHTSTPPEEHRALYNERAKRQLLRKATAKLRAAGFTSQHFLMLENHDPKTIELARKLLDTPPTAAASPTARSRRKKQSDDSRTVTGPG